MAALYSSPQINIEVVLAVNNTGLSDEEKRQVFEEIKSDYKDLKVRAAFVKENNNQFPRVKAIKDALEVISKEDSYVWIVDDDDFIFPKSIKSISKMFESGRIILGDIMRFDEKWDGNSFPLESTPIPGHYMTRLYYRGFIHDNHAPINAFIFPYEVIKRVFDDYELLGDYYEDYAITLAAQKFGNIKHYPVSIAGVSFHGEETQTVLSKDRTYWDISLSTFMSELVNKGILNSWEYDILKAHEEVTAQNKRWQPIFRLAKPVIRVSRKLKIIK